MTDDASQPPRLPGLPGDARACVLTVSDRSAEGRRADSSGPLARETLQSWGFSVDEVVVVPDDGDAIESALRDMLGADVLITTGGTGLSPRDVTPEATRRVIEREAAGIAEAIRADGRSAVATSLLSRGVAGVAGRTLIVNLPGSTGGVRDGLAVLEPVLAHAVAQLRGGDH